MSSAQDNLEGCELLYANSQHTIIQNVHETLSVVVTKLGECLRADHKRCKEKNIEEALQQLKKLPSNQLQSLELQYIKPLIQLITSIQLETLHISTACGKLDQMIQKLCEAKSTLANEETQKVLRAIISSDQVLKVKDLQTVCMFLEVSCAGREAVRQACCCVLGKVSQVFSSIKHQEVLNSGERMHAAVKVCLQMFQLLVAEVAPLVWEGEHVNVAVQSLLKHLMDIILGECPERDTRLLAGTAVVMLINTAPTAEEGNCAVWDILEASQHSVCQLRIGRLSIECKSSGYDGVERLSVIRGLLTCCRRDILIYCSHNKEICLLLDGLFPIISALCEEKLDCHYYVFQVLSLYLKCVKECLGDMWTVKGGPLLHGESNLCLQLTEVLWNNADSPVEGVIEFVSSSFHLLLDIYQLECEQFALGEKRLYSALLNRIASLPWEAKVRYFPLCALLPHVGTSMVFDFCPELPNHIVKCFSTCHLSPCASEVYKCIIQQQRQEVAGSGATEMDMANQWAQRLLLPLLEGLNSDIPLLQNNVCNYMLPCTLRTFPSAYHILKESLARPSPVQLQAWTSFMNACRKTIGSWPIEDQDSLATLWVALGSLEDSVRLAAFSLLCCSHKTQEPPTRVELSAIRRYLPLNLNSESSSFRQQLQAVLKKLLVRVRDSCLVCLKKIKKGTGSGQTVGEECVLDQGVVFVDWLAELSFTYVAPGFSYQRKKTALLLLSTVLVTCTDTWSPDKRKGQPPVDMSSLISWAKDKGQWNFFSKSKILILIRCLEDTTNEIREIASELLLRFFPPYFPSDLIHALFARANKIIRSPRVPEAQTGALLMKVLLQKSQDLSVVFQHDVQLSVDSLPAIKTGALVQHLLKELQMHYQTAQTDMLLAARVKPIHGVMTALQRCVLDNHSDLGVAFTQSVVQDILSLLERITLLLLGVLYGDQAGGADEQEAPPSFCAMGNAIHSLISQGGGTEVGDDCVHLSEEHSLILTCCWVSLKEIGIFLGNLAEKLLSAPPPAKHFLNSEDLWRVSKIFKDILLKCRHWGAVEGCCSGFTKFCSALLRDRNPQLAQIPSVMVEQALAVLRSSRSASITRRAAGLPMLVLSIVTAEEASKARPLLSHSFRVLLETAETPLPDGWDQTVDLPQVCAVHTLQALVRAAGLGVAILQFAPAITVLSLTLLSSPCWAMRNAALQLFSSMCSRMLGQWTGSDDSSGQHGMSPLAFFTHYTALQPFLLGELQRATQPSWRTSGEAKLDLQPSLFPVLSLLAKLQPVLHSDAKCLSSFQGSLLELARSPIYNVRVMASKALVAMTALSDCPRTLIWLAKQLPGPKDEFSHNHLHGLLLQMNALLTRALHTHSRNRIPVSDVMACLESKLWLVTSAQRCYLIRLAYLGVVSLVGEFCSPGFLDQLQAELLSQLHMLAHEIPLGVSSFHQQAARFLYEQAARREDCCYASQLLHDLQVQSPDAQLALVKWATDSHCWRGTGMHQLMAMALQTSLKAALSDGSVEYRRTYLTALVAVMAPDSMGSAAFPCLVSQECVEQLLGILEDSEGGPELLSKALHTVGLLLSLRSEPALTNRWCCLLEAHRVPEASEVLRMACAQSLHLAGPLLVDHQSSSSVLSVRLIDTGLHLLKDGDLQIRAVAAGFASMLAHSRRGTIDMQCLQLHVNEALLFLLNLLLEEFWDCPETIKVLLGHLPECDLAAVLREAQDEERFCLYEQDEANVYAEPAVMCEHLLPVLLQLVQKSLESPPVREQLTRWAQANTGNVLDNVRLCMQLNPGETLAWLNLLAESRFQSTICGLFVRAAVLLSLEPLCDMALISDLKLVHRLLSQNGMLLPQVIPTALGL